MVRPRVHIVASSRENNHLIASAIRNLEPEAEIVEHGSNDDFLEYSREYRPAIWEVVVTGLIKITMPPEVMGRFMPVVHFSDVPARNPFEQQKRKRHRSQISIDNIDVHLKEAIGSAKLFIRLKSGISKISSLDDRERAVVMMAADGVPNKTMAQRLNVSVKTIEHCRRKAYLKLDVKCSAEVASLITFDKFFSLFESPINPAAAPTTPNLPDHAPYVG